jgi:urocanate hydratase
LTPDLNESAFPALSLQVESFYAGLMATAAPGFKVDEDHGLGGKLFYVGELDPQGRTLVIGANIAGATSLSATADAAAQKQALRDGVIDFLVTSLDEALRILKNQVRKREAVAVCVAAAPETIQWEMLERGVLPDLVRPADEPSAHSPFVSQGARQILTRTQQDNSALLTWRVASAPAQWLHKLDAIALECVPPEDWPVRRWLRLAPRYLGRLAQGTRLLICDRAVSADFIERVREQVERGVIETRVEIQVTSGRLHDQHFFVSPGASGNAR